MRDGTSVAVEIEAPASTVWALVSDVTKMGEWSPETTGCEWIGDATGPAPGARFKGHNRNGAKKWSTTCTIVRAEPDLELTWDVTTVAGLKVARWSYSIEPLGDRRCRLTEETIDRRGRLVTRLGAAATGVEDRATHNEASMRATLDRIKSAAEFITD